MYRYVILPIFPITSVSIADAKKKPVAGEIAHLVSR